MKGTFKMLFNRHERCVGLRLWKSKTRFVQLWYCPTGYKVEPHSHNDEQIELMYLFGKTEFWRTKIEYSDVFKSKDGTIHEHVKENEGFKPRWYHMFKSFTVKAGQIHWFTVSTMPLVFINFATFLNGKEPTSAAIDFHKV